MSEYETGTPLDLFDALGLLKRNLAGCPELKERYPKGYQKLKNRIFKGAETYLWYVLGKDLLFETQDDKSRLLPKMGMEWQSLIQKEKSQGLGKRIGAELLIRCDAKTYIAECMRLSEKLRYYKTYRTYWVNHCSRIQGIWVNSILRMKWNGERWQDSNGEQAGPCVLPPPTDFSTLHTRAMQELNALCGI